MPRFHREVAAILIGVLTMEGILARSAGAENLPVEVLSEANAKYEAAIKSAEQRLQQAHEKFRADIEAARTQLIRDLTPERPIEIQADSPPIGKTHSSKFEGLPVEVAENRPTLLIEGKDSPWTEVPDQLRGAVIFQPAGDARTDGVVELTVLRDAMIGLAASWAYDGNSSGGWQRERLSKQQLVEAGWIEADKMYHRLTDRHMIFFRLCKKGETFRIRTRKYRDPYVIVPSVVEVSAPSEKPKVDPNVVVEVLGAKVLPAGEVISPTEMRAELEGTLLYDSGVTGVAVLRIHQPGPVFVAASWNYDGNSGGQWQEERWLKEDFEKNGWKELGTIGITHRGHEQEHVLFVRECNKGERFRLRSRKYGAPFVFAPRAK